MLLKSCLLTLAILAIGHVIAHGHSGHVCMHDADLLQEQAAKDLAHGPVTLSRDPRQFHSEEVGSLRYRFFTADLEDTTKYCTSVGQTVNNKLGEDVVCTADDILTTEKRSTLITSILPAAIAQISGALSHNRVVGNIVVPSSACSFHTIPTEHSSTGVADVDYVLYVSTVPATDKVLAWAAGCRKDTSGKYVVGRANFAPKYLNGSASAKADQVATAVHELMHALGFSGGEFAGRLASETRRGKTVSVLRLPKLAARVREHLGCNDASIVTGAEIEDEGGSGSVGSHFDRRILKDELMAAAGGAKMTAMVLSTLEELFNYTVDYSKAQTFEFGRFAGCSFVTDACSVTGGGKDDYWCFDSNNKNEYCDADYAGIGFCNVLTYTAALPTYFQYFSNPVLGGSTFLDGCPVVLSYSDRECTAVRDSTDLERSFGFVFRGDSHCWSTTGLIQDTKSVVSSNTHRCLQSRCKLGYPQVRVASSDFRTCLNKGDKLSFVGYDGEVVCPDPVKFCSKIEPPAMGGSPTAPYSIADAGTGLSPLPSIAGRGETTQVRGIVTFSGGNWKNMLTDYSVDIRSQAVMSFGLLFGISTGSMEVDEISAGSLVAHYDITSVYSETEVWNRFAEALKTPSAKNWMKPLADFYAEQGGTDSVTIIGHDTKDTYRVCEFAKVDDDTCFVVIAGIALCVVIIVLVIIWACCCRKSPEQKAAEAAEARKMAASANEPIVLVNKKKPVKAADKKQAAKTEAKPGAGKKSAEKKTSGATAEKKASTSADKTAKKASTSADKKASSADKTQKKAAKPEGQTKAVAKK